VKPEMAPSLPISQKKPPIQRECILEEGILMGETRTKGMSQSGTGSYSWLPSQALTSSRTCLIVSLSQACVN